MRHLQAQGGAGAPPWTGVGLLAHGRQHGAWCASCQAGLLEAMQGSMAQGHVQGHLCTSQSLQ